METKFSLYSNASKLRNWLKDWTFNCDQCDCIIMWVFPFSPSKCNSFVYPQIIGRKFPLLKLVLEFMGIFILHKTAGRNVNAENKTGIVKYFHRVTIWVSTIKLPFFRFMAGAGAWQINQNQVHEPSNIPQYFSCLFGLPTPLSDFAVAWKGNAGG